MSVRALVLSDEELLGMQRALQWAVIAANNMVYKNRDTRHMALFCALLDKVNECVNKEGE